MSAQAPWEDYKSAPLAQRVPAPQGIPQSAQAPWEDYAAPEPGTLDKVRRQVGLWGRTGLNVLASGAMQAADVGVGARNLAANLSHGELPKLADFNPFASSGGSSQEYELPSTTFNKGLTAAGLPEPKTWQEKLAGFVEGGLLGSKLPAPQASEQVPANFLNAKDVQKAADAAALKKAQDAGYVVPPATSNRSALNTTLETLAGKQSVQQVASAKNQGVTNALAKADLGLSSDAPLSAEVFPAVRAEASRAGYEPIRDAGMITAPKSLHEQLVAALSKYTGAERSFPGMGKTDLADIIAKVDRPIFDAGDAIDLTKILRDKASTAFRAGDSGTGSGLKTISNAVEDALDKGLQAKGPQYADTLDAFRNARQTIAKSYTIEDAFNPGSNNVVAQKLANALKGGEPISGPLKDAARFAAAYPRAVTEPTHSMGVSHLDIYAPLMSAMFGHGLAEKAAGLAIPASRFAARSYLLSDLGQGGALPSITAPNTGALPMGLLGAQQSVR